MKHTTHPIPAHVAETRRLAYQFWQQSGCPSGQDLAFWLKAEEELHHGSSDSNPRQPAVENIAPSDVDVLLATPPGSRAKPTLSSNGAKPLPPANPRQASPSRRSPPPRAARS